MPTGDPTNDAALQGTELVTFRDRVLGIVRLIPEGRVTNYGTVALLAGHPRAARQVGGVLYGLRDTDTDVPWQRVVNAAGGISTFKVGSGELQVALLRAEGVEVADRKVDLRKYFWPADDTVLPG